MFDRQIAKRLSRPSGLVGRFVLGPFWNHRNVALNDFAYAQLAVEPGDRVLEVGFGGGYLLDRIAGAMTRGSVVGIDASPSMIAYARGRLGSHVRSGRLELACASAESIPFCEGSFDKACSVNSIFYWQDPSRVCRELARILAPGGRLVLVFTEKASLESKGFARAGLRLYESEEVRKLLAHAGFRELSVSWASDRHRQFSCIGCLR